jgi:hypothetical protein
VVICAHLPQADGPVLWLPGRPRLLAELIGECTGSSLSDSFWCRIIRQKMFTPGPNCELRFELPICRPSYRLHTQIQRFMCCPLSKFPELTVGRLRDYVCASHHHDCLKIICPSIYDNSGFSTGRLVPDDACVCGRHSGQYPQYSYNQWEHSTPRPYYTGTNSEKSLCPISSS